MKLVDLEQKVFIPIVDESKGGATYEVQMSVAEVFEKFFEGNTPQIVEAVPVKRGRWKAYSVPHWTKRYDDNGDPEYKYHNEYVCSICRRRTIVCENYCPNCGAKMDRSAKQ